MSSGYLSLVLHWHLPFVRHPEHDRFLEEDWLFEAISETYLPLLAAFERLAGDGVPFKITVSVSPTLAAMLRDELLRERYVRHLDRLIELAEREVHRTRQDADFGPLAVMYRERFQDCRRRFVERYQRNLLSGLAALQDNGCLEIITSAATHGFLPLFEVVPEAIRAQVGVAVRSHVRDFGSAPAGFWLPECGYSPGVEEYLKAFDLGYFFVESHGILFGSQRPCRGVYAPAYCPNRVAAFPRDPESAKAVWSSEEGYPGDPVYREFYRDIGFDLPAEYVKPFVVGEDIRVNTGIKYHAITGPGNEKRPYRREQALARVQEHAEHFLSARLQQVERLAGYMDTPPLIVCPFDAELFGHWWFEGPQWLYHVLRELSFGGELGMTTPGEYLATHPIQHKSMPAASSWGRKGYHEHWVNSSNEGIWRLLHEAAARMTQTVDNATALPDGSLKDRVLRQAGRELMLAQSSDWPFMITNGDNHQYAHRRIGDHLNRFHDLLDGLSSQQIDTKRLDAIEYMDAVFPKLDYNLFATAN